MSRLEIDEKWPDADEDCEECSECGGEGWVTADCFEDTCCCAHPEIQHGVERCPACRGAGRKERGIMNQEFEDPGRPDLATPGRYRLASEATHGVAGPALAVGSFGRAPGAWWNPLSDESKELREMLRIATALERIATALEELASDADQGPEVQDLTDQLQASGGGLEAVIDAVSPANP